tara:strand:- start:4831 stop:5238 length:408 start_codon:yes stop_codon:yes gene_type:complete
MLSLLLLHTLSSVPPSSPPLPSFPPVTLDIPQNVWIEMLFIVFSIMFGSLLVYLLYSRIRISSVRNRIKKSIKRGAKSRLTPNIKEIKKPKIGVSDKSENTSRLQPTVKTISKPKSLTEYSRTKKLRDKKRYASK